MSSRYVCPNDGEVLNIVLDPSVSPPAESYKCAFCAYKATKTVALTLKIVDETYIAPSRSTKPK